MDCLQRAEEGRPRALGGQLKSTCSMSTVTTRRISQAGLAAAEGEGAGGGRPAASLMRPSSCSHMTRTMRSAGQDTSGRGLNCCQFDATVQLLLLMGQAAPAVWLALLLHLAEQLATKVEHIHESWGG